MPIEAIILPIVVWVIVLVMMIIILVWAAKLRGRYYFQFHGHEVVASVRARSLALYVDGNVEDEFMARDVRLCTLRAFIDGEEVKVRIKIGWRTQVTATAGGKELPLMRVEK